MVRSGVTTATGSVILTLPKRLTEYTLRPYFVAGAGVMRVNIADVLSVFDPTKAFAAYDIGGDAVGFLSSQVGVAWDVRRLGTLKAWAAKIRDDPRGRSGPVVILAREHGTCGTLLTLAGSRWAGTLER